ncbi:uncharacterized protein EURHEDRAFT_415614 [Aspergillus ruber CBS 135680]|uniref:Uncharacterized protein n=1 Tax=Aspergillus ruber (strain CBS 135680) TaxID=1388766 RepID=A0A017S589_ASPRC|nr:uncharacterized protein EURHEDRAFT_415614 [Aspergillus ruber CBS 135680]EYE92193.1 hypothetical protein EURHEDRAFT_415614 [Aspergillus ruber CBS 135680]
MSRSFPSTSVTSFSGVFTPYSVLYWLSFHGDHCGLRAMQDIQSTPTLLPVLRTEKIHLVSGHSSLAQKPGWRYCITMLEGAYGGIPSCFQVGHSSVYNLAARRRVSPHSCRFAAGCDLREYILQSRLGRVCFSLALDTSQTSKQEGNGKGCDNIVLVE